MKHKFAAQLHTAREELARDYPGTLRSIREMGWPAVQIGGYYGHTAEQVADYVKDNGFGVAGMHVDLPRLESELPQVVQEAERFGTPDLVCPATPAELRTPEGYEYVRRFLNGVAAELGPYGYRISYHNHDFEFAVSVRGMTALAYLLEPAPDNAILAEPDVYWVKKGGLDPVSFLRSYAGRMPLIHLKDMTTDGREYFAEIGAGSIDFAAILQWGERHGVEWYIAEQDRCPGHALDSLRISLDNLNRLAEGTAT